jgi:hypothetical protein
MKIIRPLILLFLVTIISLSCRKEELVQGGTQDIQIIVSQARAYYESQVTDTTLITPLWNDARLQGGTRLQVPVLIEKSSHGVYDYRRILIFTYTEQGITGGKIVEVYGKRSDLFI